MTSIRYPDAKRMNVAENFHGTQVADPYRWLEDHAGDDTQAWVSGQNVLMKEERDTWATRDHFADRVAQLLGSGSISPLYRRGNRHFYLRREPGQQFSVLYVSESGDERVLIDPMAIDPTGATTLDSWQLSKEGNLLAYQLSVGGTEESQLFVLDVASGAIVDGPIDRCRYSPVAWLPGEKAFYYVRRLAPTLVPASETGFHRRVYLHNVGASTESDVCVFGPGMTMTNYYGVEVTKDGHWLQVSASEGTEPRNDLWVADLTTCSPSSPAFTLVQGDVDAQTSLTFGRDGRLYIFTDRDAPRGTVSVGTPGDWSPTSWATLIPESADAVLDGVALLDGPELEEDLLLAAWTAHGIAQLTVHRARDGVFLRDVPLPGAGTIGGPVEDIDGGPLTQIVYTDHTSVPRIYTFDARTLTLELSASPPGAVAPPPVYSQQVTYTSADGTDVRLFIIAPEATPTMPRPTVLYGYGGFGIPMQPGYSAAILSWVEAGGVWAVACLRGGGEEGEEWHRAGMLANKQNVFDDFHAAAEYLIHEGWTTSSHLGVYGGSNGGLLVGAAQTQRSDLMNAVVCVAPLLDMIRYTTSELGPTWTVEYGDPQDPEQFGWLHNYSPYHRVTEGVDYPATMMVVFDNDTRTDPMHGRKMVAALQHATSGNRPILLRTEGNVGHGARSLDKSVEETADTLAFMAKWTGLENLLEATEATNRNVKD